MPNPEHQNADVSALVKEALDHHLNKQGLPAHWKLESIAWMSAIVVGLSAIIGLGFSKWVTSVAQTQTERILSGQNRDGVTVLSDTVIEVLRQDEQFKNNISSKILPNGSVLIIDRAAGCPEEWEIHEPSKGRFILAVSDGDFHETGGSEKVQLLEKHLPSHKHEEAGYIGRVSNELGEREIKRYSELQIDRTESLFTSEVGGDEPHSNMPPFIALYFCVKVE